MRPYEWPEDIPAPITKMTVLPHASSLPAAATHLSIHGSVQGVGFRDSFALQALDHGVDGWVRNRRDGSVEALIIGQPDAIAAMVTACRRGPPMSHVDAVHQNTADDDGSAGFFERATD